MPVPQFESAVVELERIRRLIESAMVDAVDVADAGRVWALDGHRGVRNWLIALTGVSPAEASRRCQVMRALRDLEHLRARLRAGEVGVCQVRELARVHANERVRDRLGDAEELMVRIAQRRCFDEFQTRVGRWTAAADRVGAERTHDEVHAARRARVRLTPAGVTLSAHGGTAQGAEMLEVFGAYVDAEFRADWDAARSIHGDAVAVEHLARSAAQREFDALWAIFGAAAERPHPVTGEQVRVPTVNIIVDQATIETHLAHAAKGRSPRSGPYEHCTGPEASSGHATSGGGCDVGSRCETDRGIPIDPRDAVAALLIGRLRRVVFDSSGVGRRARSRSISAPVHGHLA